MIWLENIKIAFQSILSNKMRSLLTMLGIIIGISSVISIVSIGDSMKNLMDQQYQNIGKNRVMLYLYNMEDMRSTDFFTQEDFGIISERFVDKFDYIGPSESITSDVSIKRNTIKLNMLCVAENYEKVQKVKMIHGRMINKKDIDRRSKCIVLESKGALKLFGKENVVGETIRVKVGNNLEDLMVVGVYKVELSAFEALFQGQSMYESSFVPYTMVFSPNYTFSSLDLFVNESISALSIKDEFLDFLAAKKHREPQNYRFYTAEEDQSQMDTIIGGMSVAVGAIAAISLLVGGIGIMNIMLVSVTERTREIGIKKALGARTKDVLFQFLIESATLSAIGGVVGTGFGVGLVMIGGKLISMPIVVNPLSIVVAVAFSMIIGIFFGYYPAKKAAKADPIDALRYE